MSEQPVNEKKSTQIDIEVNGQAIKAQLGQTLLATLISNGFRPQGKAKGKGQAHVALCGAGYCYECAVTLNGVANIRSCMTPVRPGMKIEV